MDDAVRNYEGPFPLGLHRAQVFAEGAVHG